MTGTPNPETITVEIDSEIESIVPEFLEKRKGDCVLISSLLEAGAFSEINTLGHRMKGTGGSYGFDGISAIGEVIEHAAAAGDGNAISDAVRQLADYLERVVVIYV